MRERGIVFYLSGNGINFLVPVAISSLRKHYKGRICFIMDSNVSQELKEHIDTIPDCFWIEDALEHPYKGTHRTQLWCRKAWHHIGQYPFHVNLYYDLDHVWVDKFDFSIFDEIEENDIICSSYNKVPSQVNLKKAAAEECIGEKLPFFHGINGGCCGAVKNSKGAHAWVNTIEKTRKHPFLSRNPEEFAMCILLAQGISKSVGNKWSMPISPKSFDGNKLKKELDTHLAIHCVRGTFTRSKAWCKEFVKCYNTDFMGIKNYLPGPDFLDKVKKGVEDGI